MIKKSINRFLDYLSSESGKRMMILIVGIIIGFWLGQMKMAFDIMREMDKPITQEEMKELGL